jgi:NADH-quinone oxidoreductase subunit N
MVVGSVLAIVQDDIRRLLAYSGVAHAGFILSGVVAGAAGTGEVWFYLSVYTIQLVASFAVVAAVSGSTMARSALTDYAGLSSRQPFLAATFAIVLLGMGGIPLTSGFVAKFGVFTEAWTAGFEWLVVVGAVTSVIAFFIYLRVILVMYMDDAPDQVVAAPLTTRWVLGLVVLATLVFGLFPGPLLDLAGNAVPL